MAKAAAKEIVSPDELRRENKAKPAKAPKGNDTIGKRIWKARTLYIMIVPFMIYTFIFSYYPLTGWIMAFQNFKPAKGYKGSPWVGLQQFKFLFGEHDFWLSMRNTLAMSLLNLVFGTVLAIVFALLLNEIRHVGFKKVTQTISYLPHFLSWIIVCALVQTMFSTNDGPINNILMSLHLVDKPVLFLGEKKYFWGVATFANIWKETGWNSIIYIAAISGIDPSLYEAAEIDGAGRFGKMIHVTIPGIKSTIMVLLIMNLGWVLNSSFEIPYLLGGGLLQDVSETIDIFVIRYGISIGNYSLATAAGMFKSVISLILVFGANALSNKMGEGALM